jgi:hypothetical protein
MKVYEAVFKEGETEGVYALSVVENPAMEDMWITLSEQPQKIELELADEKKRLLLGAALIPNKKIYRNIDGNEFYITFSEETIEKLAHNFFKEQNNNNSSLEHEVKLEGMSVVEGWIVEDTLKDKSANYGKQYPKGTFVTMMKVDNDEMWQKALNGEIKGFSIDALLGLQEINLNTNTNMNKEDLKSFGETLLGDIKALFNSNEETQEPKQEEVVAETATVEETEVEEPAFDLQKALDALKEEMGVEFKSMLKVELSKKDEVIETKSKEIETLKAELNKQPEVEETVVTPVETVKVDLNTQGSILELIRNNKQ